MIRRTCLLLGFWAILSMPGREARAQWNYNYGGWGWGGWGVASPESAALQGAGYYAMGAGMYNLNTAQAANIDAQTAMMWNDYVAQITHESARLHQMRVHSEFQKNQALYDANQRRIRENPGRFEIENGDALNAILDDLTNPKLGSAAQRAAKAPVPASLIAEVPFQNAAERVTLMLDNLREAVKWPEVFEGDQFTADKEKFDEIRAQLRKEAGDGEISPKSLRDAQEHVTQLRAKVTAQPLPDPLDQKEAMRFLNACSRLLDLLRKPDIQPAIIELRKVQDTTVGNLLGFMNAFNLRFGVAQTLKEKQAYQRLFEIMDGTRDQILAEAKIDSAAQARANHSQAAGFLQSLDRSGQPQGAAPQPPPPSNPR
jgi:hypothetical protein